MAAPLLALSNLVIETAGPHPTRLVDGLSFTLERGKTLCIAGESGSGKSLTALSLMRLLGPGLRVSSGTALLDGQDLLKLTPEQIRQVRGRRLGMIFQEPMTSLNPIQTVGQQLGEAINAHQRLSAADTARRARELLDQVQIPEPARRLKQHPFELSGGMRQRVMIAMALAQSPDLIIADEPTTALDVTVQAQILALLRKLQADTGTAIILITHDMGVVAEMADDVLVMRKGVMVESGTVRQMFLSPQADYTRALLAAVPRLGEMTGTTAPKRASAPGPAEKMIQRAGRVVEVKDLTVRFDIRSGLFGRAGQRVHAVEGISFALDAGETLSLVGESGCGKSTTGKALANLVAFRGDVVVNGSNLKGLSARAMKPVRRDIQMIFQDPYASLDPRMRVGDLVIEPLHIHRLAQGSELQDRAAELFDQVGLPRDALRRYPHEFSGGQRQRICIARALSLQPKVIIADESVSALDVSVQAQVLDLLQDLQSRFGIAYLFISHDMAVVEQISHRVAVMYLGRFVEIGTRAQIFEIPQHAYTRRLLSAVPIPNPARERRLFLPFGDLPSPVRPLSYEPPPVNWRDVGHGHLVAEEAA
ncbi:ABC transporter ATP-binding protein [Devosia sp. 1566]|uniref:ABC transporter ATP-binding protein n=1 Tax=Devosia sp. 1566 TaxID=2499144 RepID=UPI000FD8D424|nr:ABC transporter ATP-binding protein [Devosia sp. 1566]